MNRRNWLTLATAIVQAMDDAEGRSALLAWADQARLPHESLTQFLQRIAFALHEGRTMREEERWFITQLLFAIAESPDPELPLFGIDRGRDHAPPIGRQIAQLVQAYIDSGLRPIDAYAKVAGHLGPGRNSVDRVKTAYMRHRPKKVRSHKKRSLREAKSRR